MNIPHETKLDLAFVMAKTLRLWSFVGKFCSMTKEMSSSNRIDTLTDALYYYAENKINKLGMISLLL